MEPEVPQYEISDTLGYYALLNVPSTASDDAIKRAYREKVQVCHPDKQSDSDQKEVATTSFIRLQEAYEVLIDNKKRETYDVYGQKGLEAGLEVSTYQGSRSREEVQADWAKFQAQQDAQGQKGGAENLDQPMVVQGAYFIRVDASSFFRPYDRRVLNLPEISSSASSPNVQIALSPRDHLTLGVQTSTLKGVGGSSLVAGYNRILTPLDTLDVNFLMGLRNVVQVTSTRRFSDISTAALTVSWQADAGVGLQLSSQQQLTQQWAGEATVMLGPQEAHGVALVLTRQAKRSKIILKIELGVSMGVSLRYILAISPKVLIRASAKLGLAGFETEAGVTRRLPGKTATGFAVHLGAAGVTAKLSVSRQGQQLQIPILLSRDSRDWAMLLGATVLPPLIGTVIHFGIIRPVFRRYRLTQAMARRRQGLEQVQESIAAAVAAQQLLHAVGYRRAVQLAAKGGLVIVEALHGRQEAMPLPCLAAEDMTSDSIPDGHSREENSGGGSDSSSEDGIDDSSSASDASSSGGSRDHSRAARAATAQAEAVLTAAGELPPQWLDVTAAVRYMVSATRPPTPQGEATDMSASNIEADELGEAAERGKLLFHNGVRKSGLMGFADVAPGEDKVLRIAYVYQGVPYLAHLLETQAAELPRSCGTEVSDGDLAQRLLVKASHLELSR